MNLYQFPSNPDGPLVNLAYANGFPPQTYMRALQPLFKDYHVVSIHNRTMWEPPCPPASLRSWRQLGNDLLAALGELTGAPVIGIGHSVGAIATMYAATTRPDRFSKLILIDPTMTPHVALWGLRLIHLLHQEDRIPLVRGALKRGRAWESVGAAYDYFRAKQLFVRWSDEMVRTYAESVTVSDGRGGVRLAFTPEWEAQIYRTVATDIWRLPAQIRTPLLVLRGELSNTFHASGAAYFQQLNPRARIVTVNGAGHLIPQEQPEQVGKLIADFLEAV